MKRLLIIPLVVTGLCISGCEKSDETDIFGEDTLFDDGEADATEAVAHLQPMEGSSVTGTITFTSGMGDGLEIEGDLTGLDEGKHGFHVHGGSSCTQPGDHFNPDGAQHSAPDSTSRHLGDLGNVDAGSDSTASVNMTVDRIRLDSLNSIVGHALIVHENEDDLTTQPSGNSGPAVACGVIKLPEGDM